MNIQHFERFFSDFQIYRLRPGNIIKLVRHTLSLTTREFAKKTHLSQTDVVRCESGENLFSDQKMWLFLESVDKIFPYKCHSTYTTKRIPIFKNLKTFPPKDGNFKLDFSVCFQESLFRENHFKFLLTPAPSGYYEGNHFYGHNVLRMLLFRFLQEKQYGHSANENISISEKVLYLIAWFQNIITHEQLFDMAFCKKNIYPQKDKIIDQLGDPMVVTHTIKPNSWIIDLCMLIFTSFNINFEERCIQVNIYKDIEPPSDLTMCWETGLALSKNHSNK